LERAIELHALVQQAPSAETLLPAIGAWFDGVFRMTLTSRGVDAAQVPRFADLGGEKTMLAENLGHILDERHEKGLQEGLQKGREEGREEGEARGIAKGREEGEARGIAKGREEGEARGIAKGREEGRVEGALTLLLRLVEVKFGAISDDDKVRLLQLDHDQIIRASSRMLTATTLEEIL